MFTALCATTCRSAATRAGILLLAATGLAFADNQSASLTVIKRAHAFLASADVGKQVVAYTHLGSDYRGHEYVETRGVSDGNGGRKPGHFALVYRFRWHDDGVSNIAFLCNPSGRVYGVRVLETNAVWSQPFALANAAVSMLGNMLIEAYKENMDASQRRIVQRLVDQADAKGMLEWALTFQQTLHG